MKKLVGQTEVNVNEEGYLTDFNEWNKNVAENLAEEHDIKLTERHWEVIAYLQGQHQKEEPLSIRGIKKSGVIDIKEFYALFPGGPLKMSTLIAGIPKPKSCI
ncbi:MAG TPA: TusE/DsrC/DsvC family sulfur relay protein [Flavobacteriaceae bacterium]|nr:TusE/DsrC/DsvC family sulfur relay protein [Flavobacteriaceae bacterium]MCB9212460.1 TusE/DsrC/DsvC family sulfur relay protein [Alteromonas sp.]HPF10523.1 TusE/DsrC/DsvC family sulfur relay protein [Flavobacteriaceae bacterium]HQU20211.1 TusE/DsrC/DsvC family sulfur relay protein [Flavobacteriaceae bacterium]HQU64700.1 TusE/DsrC/DsvC family sulfur relay protein [Flavobacteriaceae bacterium]